MMVSGFRKYADLITSHYFNKKPRLSYAIVSPTSDCNMDCVTCWRRTPVGKRRIKEIPLRFEEIIRVISELNALGCREVNLTGVGEPMCYNRFIEVAQEIKRYDMVGSLLTNGTLFNENNVNQLDDMGWDSVCISIQGTDSKSNNRIRKSKFNAFKKVLDSIKLLKRTSMELILSPIVHPMNYKKLNHMVDFADGYGIRYIYFHQFCDFHFFRHRFDKHALSNSIMKAMDQADEYKIRTNLKVFLNYFKEGVKPKKCFFPYRHLVVDFTGDVLPCVSIIRSGDKRAIGNVREDSLADIWFNQMDDIRKRFSRGELFPECKDCIFDYIEQNKQLETALKPWKLIRK